MKEEFNKYIEEKINGMTTEYIELESGEVHRELGGYPGKNHRMRTCCDALYDHMKGDDEKFIPENIRSGYGAYIKVRYYKRNH